MRLNSCLITKIERHLGGAVLKKHTKIQSLWGEYGGVYRLHFENFDLPSAVLKIINFEKKAGHPYGWSTDLSHKRKIQSYFTELHWYKTYAHSFTNSTCIPKLLWSEQTDNQLFILLSDAGAPLVNSSPPILFEQVSLDSRLTTLHRALTWLAQFHAAHILPKADPLLWQMGSYWSLDKRPDEYKALADTKLKTAAVLISNTLKSSPYKTIIHGDAKIANFVNDQNDVLNAVDFQYCGFGVGVTDCVGIISSLLSSEECFLYEQSCLDHYFTVLKGHCRHKQTADIITNWRHLYPFAWADFVRFLKGWQPNHWKLHRYALTHTEFVLTSF